MRKKAVLSRRQILQAGVLGAAASATRLSRAAGKNSSGTPAAARSAGAIDIDLSRQLFLDDRLLDLEQSRNVGRTLNPPHDIRRVLKPDRPWESLGFIFYCSLVEDGGALKLYYGSYSFDTERRRHLCLATSTDGLTWEKPRLGLKEFPGSKDSNILALSAVEAAVFLDPARAGGKRYRMVMTGHWPDPATAGMYVASSADGVRWEIGPRRVLPFVPDSQPAVVWEDRREEYAVFLRAWNPGRCVARVAVRELESPWPYDRSVAPLHVWGKDKIPTLSRELPIVMARDDQDPENLHLYTSGAVKYPLAPDVYFALPAAYLCYRGREWRARALNANDGPFEVQLATSRDGIRWTRWRQPYVGPGFYDGLDLRLVSMGGGMVRRGPDLYQYFVGWPYTHGQPVHWERNPADRAEWMKKDRGGIYCAVQRVDGFLSMDAAYRGGTLTTLPLVFRGNRLRLNINTAASGSAKVAILDPSGKPIPGFAAADCETINANAIDREVCWKHGPDVAALAGRPVRLQWTMRNTKLYAMQFTSP